MTASNPPIQDRAPIELPHRERMEILFAVLLGILLAALDQTIVGTALPTIVTDLNGNDVYTWAFTSYLLTATVSGPIYGKLSDLYGRRNIFIIGVAIFLLGSLLCALSQEMWQFIVFRGVQGLGAGALFPVALAIIGELQEANDLMEKLLRIASPLGLYAEELDAASGHHLGNFPQAFSHLALLQAAARIIVEERMEEFFGPNGH